MDETQNEQGQNKTILGLDLGTNSIGWALVDETRNEKKKLIDAHIIKLGVRVNPLTTDEQTDFEKGKPLSTNANRTLKRGARRNLQRYKLRREDLIKTFTKHKIINKDTPLTEVGPNSTHQTLRLRAKAATERIELNELARVLLSINKKRGYKSNRKARSEEEGSAVDGMAVAKYLYDNQLTPGQYCLKLLQNGKKYLPDFYRSDLKAEFDSIWENQQEFYPELLTKAIYQNLEDKGSKATWAICRDAWDLEGIKLEGKRNEQKLEKFQIRVNGIKEKLDLEHLAIALQEINNEINKSSGYLGKISDRSKILYSDGLTVGEFLHKQIQKDPHTSLKNQVFYRQDYMDEFERIWETQSKFHSVLTSELKEEIRDTVIFYQRKLKSQKGLISHCIFESWQEPRKDIQSNIVYNKVSGKPKMRTVGHRVIPKSSPLFQEFKIWQQVNNLEIKAVKETTVEDLISDDHDTLSINDEQRQVLFEELNLRGKLTETQVLKALGLSAKNYKTNYKDGVDGNRTNAAMFNIYQIIAENEGYGFDWAKKSAAEILEELKAIFPLIGINPEVLVFNPCIDGNDFDKQASYHLWHLLYSAEDEQKISEKDKILYGNDAVAIKRKLHHDFGFKPEYARLMAGINLSDDYGNLSARAIRKIIPHLQDGNSYDQACALAVYNHSNSLTKEENDKRELKEKLDILPKNSLRNPVVEKILNQMINLVNQIIEEYGKPDEIRIELARELKKSAKEREETTKFIANNTKANDEIRKIIQRDYGFSPTRNDVIRYKLWLEIASNGHKTIFTDEYIAQDQIFSKDIDIEHILPKSLLFDDSFSNKTLAFREVNLKKDNRTALDFINQDYNSQLEKYISRVESLYKNGAISKGKYKKLLMSQDNLPDGFIERDLRNSQYIARKATALLQELVRPKVLATTGKITHKLRADWDLINVMKELNLPKYKALGLTKKQTRWDTGQEKEKEVEIIENWTKRNDHRHHAMDALTVAFTHHNHIQYINNLNARRNEHHKKHANVIAIEKVITRVNNKGKRYFIPPLPNFRKEAKKHIESILVSFKAKNKVVTKNINRIKKKKGYYDKTQLTPRGQLHKETVYGKMKKPMDKTTKLNKRFSLDQIDLIIDAEKKELVKTHLAKYNNDPARAFDTRTYKKDPILWKEEPLREVKCFEEIYTIRKDIGPDLKISKVVDDNIRAILESHLKKYGNAKNAFSDIERYPIWFNKEAGIKIKRVTITGVSNAEALHYKKDHFGKLIVDKEGNPVTVDYVSTGNNHHVAIYRDPNGKLQEQVVSFYEAVARVHQDLPIIDKSFNSDLGWKFLFTMKQNEMFVFPNNENNFNPSEIDLFDEANAYKISKNLYRVQKFTNKDYFFRHHLETTVDNKKETHGKNWMRSGLNGIDGIVKIRLNHLGKVLQVGEY